VEYVGYLGKRGSMKCRRCNSCLQTVTVDYDTYNFCKLCSAIYIIHTGEQIFNEDLRKKIIELYGNRL
jgi:ABC-type uncharacterized transport system ATPase subunit